MDPWSVVRDVAQSLATRSKAGDVPIACVSAERYKAWLKRQSKATAQWLKVTEFKPEAGRIALLPGPKGDLARILLGVGSEEERRQPWTYAPLATKLPPGRYAFEDDLDADAAEAAALGWMLGRYKFTRYRAGKPTAASLVWPKGADRARSTATAQAIVWARDLINTPAEDMGPAELAQAAEALAEAHDARIETIVGDALCKANYPAVYAVGRACSRPPRLVDVRWGDPKRPKLTLVGKGVCFDTGGLDLKNSANMKLMKKDMGGAAAVLGLAHLVMATRLPVCLRVLVPAVENSVSGNAMRPGDVLSTRKGLTVEIGNTDAEGRLILCDALTEADREDPDLLIDFATLTGAARVALGTELPALFTTDPAVGDAIRQAGERLDDPVWPMPLFRPYRRHIESPIADLNNASNIAYGGAITAALFLQEFVDPARRWVHIDTMGWNASARPGRPTGGEALAVRAVFAMLEQRYRR